MGEWPARLLDVSIMTSLKWQPGNVYGTVKEPRYAIISYTWGRWRLPEEDSSSQPMIQLSGITWKVPSVDPDLFQADEFQNIIQKIAREASCRFVWVDVACIDQNLRSPENAREVGRQAKIFRTAHQAFIWLVAENKSLSEGSAEDMLRILERSSRLADSAHRRWFFDYALPNSDESINLPEEKQPLSDDTDYDWAGNAAHALANLTDFPWFSSLWTLQEGFLRRSAKFLSRGGNYTTSDSGHPFSLDDLLAYCQQFHQLFSTSKISPTTQGDSAEVLVLKRGLLRIIERAGLEALAQRDRMTLYSSSQARVTSDPADRIYGIMQVWDFALGKAAPAADAGRTWTLDELELELGKSLLREFPVESQLHVHLSTVAGRQSWRVSQQSATPHHTLYFSESGHLEGTLDRQSAQLGLRLANGTIYAHFTGKSCTFESLRQAWTFFADYDHHGRQRTNRTCPVRLSLDSTSVLNQTVLQCPYSLQNVPESRQLELAEAISTLFLSLHRSLSVLLLGTVTQQQYEPGITTAIGLLVMTAPDNVIGGWQKRLGICLWHVPDSDPEAVSEYRDAVCIMSTMSPKWDGTECIVG
jgi:hypothetical protein